MTPEQIAAEVEDHELAKLLIELAWLTPPGTNVKQHSAWMQLERYINAVRATAALRRQSPEAARLREALEPFAAGAGNGVWGKWKAWIVAGAPTHEEGIHAARHVTELQSAASDALYDTLVYAAPGSTPTQETE